MKLNPYLFGTINFCVNELHQQKVIAYPTEAVFALGCDPNSKIAVKNLLSIKQRSIKKGFILIASNYTQLEPYIAKDKLTVFQLERMFSSWPGPITYLVPAAPHIPLWFTGAFKSLAIRVSNHPIVQNLCNNFGKPLITTSANLSGQPPCRKLADIKKQFGSKFPVLNGETGGYLNPSEIRDIITGEIIRHG
ncbi:Sua5/YciO/YrdC/YwlC family protein [Pantoea sp. Mhis]|uniref:Sua5/YciO/YrdC/YwlC family protein n=1 Tax=Pantoea sp. Mhis TaxID=2576759 RepID=UPI00135A8C0D|nr:Sua5/YciO/YrdC/YwlC family protein [Pantoea sp. Mhis]MXP56575.1 L-threonylcarbamoyladenylate synthase type 1 TsaC [Pantoea sp. Mhis]